MHDLGEMKKVFPINIFFDFKSMIIFLKVYCDSYKFMFKEVRFLDYKGDIVHKIKDIKKEPISIPPDTNMDTFHNILCTDKN